MVWRPLETGESLLWKEMYFCIHPRTANMRQLQFSVFAKLWKERTYPERENLSGPCQITSGCHVNVHGRMDVRRASRLHVPGQVHFRLIRVRRLRSEVRIIEARTVRIAVKRSMVARATLCCRFLVRCQTSTILVSFTESDPAVRGPALLELAAWEAVRIAVGDGDRDADLCRSREAEVGGLVNQ